MMCINMPDTGGFPFMMVLHIRSHAERFARGIRTKLSGRDTSEELFFFFGLLSLHSHGLGSPCIQM